MESNTTTREEKPHLLPPKKDLRRVYSDVPKVTDEIIKDTDRTKNTSEVERMECVCCGMYEDCTPTYIRRIKEFYCGNWICGLCSEAVKEKVKRAPTLAMEEALESHISLCQQFNRTVRLNPKLSLAGTMRDIARSSSQRRIAKIKNFSTPKIGRTISCGPRIDV